MMGSSGKPCHRRVICRPLASFDDFRICSASSDAFGPKIVSADNLPGTPMDHRSSMEEDLNRSPTSEQELQHYINGSTRLVVKNELNERRRSLDYVNRPPSPSHFIQFTAGAATTNGVNSESTTFPTQLSSPKLQESRDSNVNKYGPEKTNRGPKNNSQDSLHHHNGSIQLGSRLSLSNNNNVTKDDKEVSALGMLSEKSVILIDESVISKVGRRVFDVSRWPTKDRHGVVLRGGE